MRKYSPAPWHVEFRNVDGKNTFVESIESASGETICETDSGCYGPKADDAILMASAPTMRLAIIQALLSYSYIHKGSEYADAEAALWKALSDGEGVVRTGTPADWVEIRRELSESKKGA